LGISRRVLVGGALTGLGLGGAYVYRQAPPFWQQYRKEMFAGITAAAHRPKIEEWSSPGLKAAWLGHATCLIRMDGFTILTDPVFSDRCGIDLLLTTLGPKRLVKPALEVKELPKIDLILLSHAHFDHWDLPSLASLAGKDVPVICARQTGDLLTPSRWKSVTELGWREEIRTGAVTIRGVETKHWGARVRRDSHRGYNGYLISTGRQSVLFGCDTAYTDSFRELKTSRGIDLAIMPIGAYNPWIANHCTPEQAVQMADWAGAERIMPVHHKTFVLSQEPLEEPIERLYSKLGRSSARIVAPEIGMEWRHTV
jgi:L-ascorbate metabolism protein UlaG (beta-lactamase superfamily)